MLGSSCNRIGVSVYVESTSKIIFPTGSCIRLRVDMRISPFGLSTRRASWSQLCMRDIFSSVDFFGSMSTWGMDALEIITSKCSSGNVICSASI